MAIQHAGLQMRGTHGPVTPEPPELHTRRVKYWGVHGERELFGGQAGRVIAAAIVLHGNYGGWQILDNVIDRLDAHVGANGVLLVTGNLATSYFDTTFLGFDRAGDPESRDGPLLDVAGTLDGGWWIRGTLRWRQLKA